MQPHTHSQGTLHLAKVNIGTHTIPTVLYGIHAADEECASEDIQLHFCDSSTIHVVVFWILSNLCPVKVEGLLYYCCCHCCLMSCHTHTLNGSGSYNGLVEQQYQTLVMLGYVKCMNHC